MITESEQHNNYLQVIFLVLAIAVMAVIFIHSAMPADLSTAESSPLAEMVAAWLHIGIEPATILVRKTAHLTEYCVLGMFLTLAINGSRLVGGILGKQVLIVWLIGTAYAVSDEGHQYFVPGRSCEIRDIFIDAVGVAAGIAIAAAIRSNKRKI